MSFESFELVDAVIYKDKYGNYYHYCCNLCNCELKYGSYYCKKCNNVVHPCEDCQIGEKFVKTTIIAYKTKYQSDEYYKLFETNVVLDDLFTFISKCPKCKIIENPINCDCEGSCPCVSLGKNYNIEYNKDNFKDENVPLDLLN